MHVATTKMLRVLMRTIYYPEMYARHDLIIESACLWLEDVIFNFIQVFNPPYVLTPDEEVHRNGIARAWAGGRNGRRVIDRVLSLVTLLTYFRPASFTSVAYNGLCSAADNIISCVLIITQL